jgi:hypothetical protein
MSQVNKYADKAGYTADKNRKDTQSAVSYIENDGMLVYDGVNVVVDKPAAGVGDLAVFDKTTGTIRFVKGATLHYDQMPAQLVPAGVVYARQGGKVLVVALNRNTRGPWAYEYEVKLSGFNLAAGGEFTLNIYTSEFSFTYPAGSTLADIADLINNNSEVGNTYSWEAKASDELSAIVMSCNAWSTTEGHKKISATGCELTRRAVDVDYQSTLTGLLTDTPYEYIRRNNYREGSFAGCNTVQFLKYYSVNGSQATGVVPGDTDIIRESVFTEADNPALVATYPTYRDYLVGEHLVQWPSAYSAMLRDGKTNTNLIGRLTFTDIYGKPQYRYPAAAAAHDYGVAVDGMTTGLEAGAWWLPSVDEIYMLMHDRVNEAADADSDPLNLTLSRLGKSLLLATTYFWSSCEYNAGGAYINGGNNGTISSASKPASFFFVFVSAV